MQVVGVDLGEGVLLELVRTVVLEPVEVHTLIVYSKLLASGQQ